MNADKFDELKVYLRDGISVALATAACGVTEDELTDSQRAEISVVTKKAEAELVRALSFTARGIIRGDVKTAIMLLERLNPTAWAESVLGGEQEGSEEAVVKALQKRGWKVTR